MEDQLGTHVFQEFMAERIDDVIEKKMDYKKMIFVKSTMMMMDKGFELTEQGTWHYKRKKAIIAKYPQVLKLYGNTPITALFGLALFVAHLFVTYLVAVKYDSWIASFVMSYALGAYFAFDLNNVCHEAIHRLVFKNSTLNRLLGMIAMLPCWYGPFGSFFAVEHMWHHNAVVDKCLRYGPQNNPLIRKVVITFLFMFFVNFGFALMTLLLSAAVTLGVVVSFMTSPSATLAGHVKLPAFVHRIKPYDRFPQLIKPSLFFNTALAVAYHFLVFYYLGGWKATVYQLASTCFSNGLHPLGMRQVQEHYILSDQPSYSVYSSWGPMFMNVGMHCEHHDFPLIPCWRLPQLRKIAPEFYDNLVQYKDYTSIFIDFLTKPGIPLKVLLESNELVGALFLGKKLT